MGQLCRCIIAICISSFSFSTISADVQVMWQNGQTPERHIVEKVSNWLDYGLAQVASTLTDLQQSSVPVFIHLKEYANEPVPWGEVARGDLDGITLHIHKNASLAQLKADWTLYHELAHLYHPFFDYGDSWLGEGLATYLQNVVMLQAGMISKDDFTQRISAGLTRGEAATPTFQGKLSTVSANMWQLGAYQRVYWSGTAFFIESEAQLKAAGSKYNLTALLARYQTCCKKSIVQSTNQTAVQFLTALDNLAKADVFIPLYLKYRVRGDFPNISQRQIRYLSNQYAR
ncbi:hypothetical protein N473_14685 [Pseudoalteromonas luteoviolacea CPMOR-1]|uniref:Peptidase M61 catalytic domain-containing protein n=1 Tax=Pseudoalteromonas luteoviolacea CPMOR-1 TaxID=1365248 RepID=A0A167LI20_9GAMM|nr:hypothetical protein [Pseudoalteromonas luteoviolacea]KZN64568.1 hypothetical protein N473_14685 [Pseudoalteromonas luteoviolacea CPMOR-1]